MCYGSGAWCLSTWKVSLVMLRAVETFWEIFRICKTPGFLQHSWRLSIGDSHALQGMPHDTAADLLCRRMGVRGSRWAQGHVFGDMRVPHTESPDHDRSSST